MPGVSAKGQGLIALLATSPKGERTRQWLQAKLWSDRGPEQASGSLRQELAQIRNLLEKAGIGLTADRHRVALDLQTVKILRGGPPVRREEDRLLRGPYYLRELLSP